MVAVEQRFITVEFVLVLVLHIYIIYRFVYFVEDDDLDFFVCDADPEAVVFLLLCFGWTINNLCWGPTFDEIVFTPFLTMHISCTFIFCKLCVHDVLFVLLLFWLLRSIIFSIIISIFFSIFFIVLAAIRLNVLTIVVLVTIVPFYFTNK